MHGPAVPGRNRDSRGGHHAEGLARGAHAAVAAAGAVPRMPFWNGDYPWRPYELGVRIGKFRREIVEKIKEHQESFYNL